ncbi:hypothetical protein PR202_gb22886 [Eleusine coracana subsp. coracana]|uniref:Uncharacterized protein n=1 Tax=Eleusine coracana subsp. coracana TaxID=191504 RepID=A0AAV5FEU4_ELECO|nr:hypothetical protein PR202_gb22886 [Eleusine coracana subsp. coracana]
MFLVRPTPSIAAVGSSLTPAFAAPRSPTPFIVVLPCSFAARRSPAMEPTDASSMEVIIIPDSDEEEEHTPELDATLEPACKRCESVHAADNWRACREAYELAHPKLPCSRCWLFHEPYEATVCIYGLDHFDCELLIPDVSELRMDGDIIILPEHVLKVLDEMEKKKEDVKKNEKKEDAKEDGKTDV